MKITYLAYLRLLKQHPDKIKVAIKVIPGDNVEVADSLSKFLEESEIVENKKVEEESPEVCDQCLKIKSRCVCKERERVAARKQAAIDAVDPEEKENKKIRKEEEEKLVIDANTEKINKILSKKEELKQSGKSKLEQKQELKEFKEELEFEANVRKAEPEKDSPKVEEEMKEKVEVKEEPKVEEKQEVKSEKAKPKKKLKGKGKVRKDPVTGEFYKEE